MQNLSSYGRNSDQILKCSRSMQSRKGVNSLVCGSFTAIESPTDSVLL